MNSALGAHHSSVFCLLIPLKTNKSGRRIPSTPEGGVKERKMGNDESSDLGNHALSSPGASFLSGLHGLA